MKENETKQNLLIERLEKINQLLKLIETLKMINTLKEMAETMKKEMKEYVNQYFEIIKEKEKKKEEKKKKEYTLQEIFETKERERRKKGFIFYCVKNREEKKENTGLIELSNILCQEYDNVEYGVSATLKHEMIFELIQQISQEKTEENGENEREENETKIEEEKKPFVEVSYIKNCLSKIANGEMKIEKFSVRNEDEEDFEERKVASQSLLEIEKILLDLSKLGVIIYFNDFSLKDVVVSDPRWFNKVISIFFFFSFQFF